MINFDDLFTTIDLLVLKKDAPFIDAYQCLVFCIISLRTKDEVAYPTSKALFDKAPSPQTMIDLEVAEIAQTIYPCGFFNRKAQEILDLSLNLILHNQSQPPKTLKELLLIRGVGLKTANLVLSRGHHIDAICVDIHVHRICNRLGIINTKSPDDSEAALRSIMPRRWWIKSNELLVRFGQQICKPVKALCPLCPFNHLCPYAQVC